MESRKLYPPVSILDDCIDNLTLSELAERLPTLMERFGKHAVIEFDAGYNNVSAYTHPTKKQKPFEPLPVEVIDLARANVEAGLSAFVLQDVED